MGLEWDAGREQIEKSREVIREAVKYCEDSEGDKPIPEEYFAEDGEIDEEHIRCSRCGLLECEDVRPCIEPLTNSLCC
jgi:hypothetical protein